MFEAGDIREWRGHDVVDPDDHKIGELEAVYVDTSTDLPAFGTVRVDNVVAPPFPDIACLEHARLPFRGLRVLTVISPHGMPYGTSLVLPGCAVVLRTCRLSPRRLTILSRGAEDDGRRAVFPRAGGGRRWPAWRGRSRW